MEEPTVVIPGQEQQPDNTMYLDSETVDFIRQSIGDSIAMADLDLTKVQRGTDRVWLKSAISTMLKIYETLGQLSDDLRSGSRPGLRDKASRIIIP